MTSDLRQRIEQHVTEAYTKLDRCLSTEEYNFERYRPRHAALSSAKAVIQKRGISPGAIAPEFNLPRADGGMLSLRELSGAPVLIHFASWT